MLKNNVYYNIYNIKGKIKTHRRPIHKGQYEFQKERREKRKKKLFSKEFLKFSTF